MDEETRGHIAQQLADVLEQADHSFSLELEWFSLQAEFQQAGTTETTLILGTTVTRHNG